MRKDGIRRSEQGFNPGNLPESNGEAGILLLGSPCQRLDVCFDEILKRFPAIRKDHPFFGTRRGKRFLAAYTKPAAVAKHLHNHRDYEYKLVK